MEGVFLFLLLSMGLSLDSSINYLKFRKERMWSVTYKPILVASVLTAILATTGITTTVRASVDCSLSNDARCLKATMLPPESIQFHHSNITAYCLFGVLLGTWVVPTTASSIGNTPICRSLP
jgi:hypothetical protein